jgi:Ca2+-binding RTX toxin-like protein
MSRVTVSTVLMVALFPAVSIAGPSSAGDLTCHGAAATIVGTLGSDVLGTEGPDVIVTNGAVFVSAKGGNDRVCATGSADRPSVNAGTGDDLVDMSGHTGTSSVHAWLGAGDDTYIGISGTDVVDAAGYYDEVDAAEGHDVVSTGAGKDYVTTGGTASKPGTDDIDLGAGNDELELQGWVQSGTWTAGLGFDELDVWMHGPAATWVFNNALRQATRNGVAVATWQSIESFQLANEASASTFSFIGGSNPERVTTTFPLKRAALGGGDDWIEMWIDEISPSRAMAVYGQQGKDTIRLGRGYNDGPVDVNFGAGTFRLARPTQAAATSTVRGFEKHRVYAYWARVIGTARSDVIGWNVCKGSLSAGDGNDALSYLPIEEDFCGYMGDAYDFPVHGGSGRDVLRGGRLPDVLIGGAGVDYADGAGMRDVCRTERASRCEVR